MRVFLYILSVWHDPDTCEQGVPWVVDDSEIFFGPCKRRLRASLRADYLRGQAHRDMSSDDVFVVGLNGANAERLRKIIWVGKITSLMTFAHAWGTLNDPRYREMREDRYSPLHLQPLFESGQHTGYRLASEQHLGQWLEDLTAKLTSVTKNCVITDDEIKVNPGRSPSDVFERDACLLLERRFVANGRGIDLSAPMLDILRQVVPLRPDDSIDAYAVFGTRLDGSVEGKAGGWVELAGGLAERFIALVTREADTIAALERQQEVGRVPVHATGACDC